MSDRDDLLNEGVPKDVISAIETLFKVDEFAHRIDWFQHDVPTLRLACPRCGCESDVHLDAVTDFFCPDDQVCGYDYAESNENEKPVLV